MAERRPATGNLLAAGVLALLGAVMSPDAFLAWGWRIAFALSALLVVVGLWLRLYVAETPLFQAAQAQRDETAKRSVPLAAAVRRHWREILLAALTRFGENAGFYIYSLFVITFVTQALGMDSSIVLVAVMIGQALAVVTIPLFATWADRVGRRPVYIGASVATVVWAFAFFALLETRHAVLITVAVTGGLLIFAAYSGVIGAFFSELFPTEVRYSGVSLAYNLASVLAGGLSPIIALALYQAFGTGFAVAVYLALMGLVSLVATLLARETRNRDLATVR